MGITTDTGKVLTDEMLDKMAAEYETGSWQGHLKSVALGRPRISDEELVTISFKIPKSRIAVIDNAARRSGETRSEFLRDAVDMALVARSA